ncbi:DUF2341 domain-containing protein [Pyrococcus horikoshii]|uniref:DUF2341 domain-containing protein n=3 Tax=Pyrococcus horikoshii TaxID=53953 RepID=O59068_PYRHO|nr:DUF2341 domain-containing protein [Pyrococcus horikoshii]BAA30449.1 816aa long hypothetical protein [Pyrococcus horikoshii OT3]HII60346.1 DUF2341 domain-containing protein [Pyrococcus horikoshii]
MRRGFILNSAVLVLLIPLLLLVATYEDVSSFIVKSQSERFQLGRTHDLVTFLDLEFQRALEISGKRAVVTIVDYVSLTGNFINPNYMVNNTIADLVRTGSSPSISGYDPTRIMQGQTLRNWLSNISSLLIDQGFILYPDDQTILKSIKLKVAPLDAFRIIIKGFIPNITIRDKSGRIVYSGPIPSNGKYAYSVVSIVDMEDPFHSAMTGGRYHRSIRVCKHSIPEFGQRPIILANGSGESNKPVLLGRYGETLLYNSTHIYDDEGNYITNLTINGVNVSTSEVIKNIGDMGVIVFSNISGQSYGWCSSLGYRVNITVTNNLGEDLTDYQIPLLISVAKLPSDVVNAIFENTNSTNYSDIFKNGASIEIYDSSCNKIPFWIEYWDPVNKKALIWIRDSIGAGQSKTYSLYFGEGNPTKGNGDQVFLFFDDFEDGTWDDKWYVVEETPSIINGELYIPGGNETLAIRTKSFINYNGGFAVRFRMKGKMNADFDAGIGVEDVTGLILLFTDDYYPGQGLAIWWAVSVRNYYLWLLQNFYDYGREDITTYHTYEAIIIPAGIFRSEVTFKDLMDASGNLITGRDNTNNYLIFFFPPRYLYLVIDSGSKVRGAYFDYVFIRKYPEANGDLLDDSMGFSGIALNAGDVEEKPFIPTKKSPGAAYDIQPLIDCLLDQRYFAIKDGWSFFERLEGSNKNHLVYERMANETQDELGISYNGKHFPIGLVSFMIPYEIYDRKLATLMIEIGKNPNEERVSSADYYFLTYYFGGGNKVEGYRVWGISYGVTSEGDLSNIPFFLDPQTAKEILGTQGTCDLLVGYNCR